MTVTEKPATEEDTIIEEEWNTPDWGEFEGTWEDDRVFYNSFETKLFARNCLVRYRKRIREIIEKWRDADKKDGFYTNEYDRVLELLRDVEK